MKNFRGFVGGILHPLSGPDHLLAMISVGQWGEFLGRPLIFLLPVVFAAAGGWFLYAASAATA